MQLHFTAQRGGEGVIKEEQVKKKKKEKKKNTPLGLVWTSVPQRFSTAAKAS
jgi:hypothetical protein